LAVVSKSNDDWGVLYRWTAYRLTVGSKGAARSTDALAIRLAKGAEVRGDVPEDGPIRFCGMK
jgi:hypothetical protein